MAAKRLDDVEAGRRSKEASDRASAQLRAEFDGLTADNAAGAGGAAGGTSRSWNRHRQDGVASNRLGHNDGREP